MLQENNDIDLLIGSYLTGQLDDQQRKKLNDWIESSKENRIYFEQSRDLWAFSGIAEHSKKYDKWQAYERFRNRTASSRNTKSRVLRLWHYGAAAAVLAVFFILGILTAKWNNPVIKENTACVISAPIGSKSVINLPDGSKVWLNAESKISYPSNFGTDNRDINLEGEGYFEVTHNARLPFIVNSDKLSVKVLGTKFNVRNYPDDSSIRLSLIEGSVEGVFRTGQNERHTLILKPNQQAVFNKASKKLATANIKASNSTEWTRGNLFFDEEKLEDIVRILERSYNVKITIANPKLKGLNFYGEFMPNTQNIRDVMEIISTSRKVNYTIKGNNITIY